MSPTDPLFASHSENEPSAVLTVRGLEKSFGTNRVLDHIDLDVGQGQVLALIGSSGSGKTTILRCLNGLELADAGTINVADQVQLDFSTRPTKQELAALRDRSGMVFQHYNLFPHMTVLENIIEGPIGVHRRPRAEVLSEATTLLERVGLLEKKDSYPFELSGGQQQRVGIARALALKPQLLLFDEPTSALDPELVGDVLSLIKDLAGKGWSMVIVTHELQFAREVAHEVAFVDGGRILERGHPDQVLRNPQNERTKQFLHRLLFPF